MRVRAEGRGYGICLLCFLAPFILPNGRDGLCFLLLQAHAVCEGRGGGAGHLPFRLQNTFLLLDSVPEREEVL